MPYDQWGKDEQYTRDVRAWGYSAPEASVEALLPHLASLASSGESGAALRALDVGCGNGLVGPVMRAKLGADANTSQLALTVEGALQPERARPDQDPNKQCAASDCAAHVRRWQARTSHRGC